MPSWEFSFCFFVISYAYICTCITRHLEETIPSSSITRSEMEKQNIQAKEVYLQTHSHQNSWVSKSGNGNKTTEPQEATRKTSKAASHWVNSKSFIWDWFRFILSLFWLAPWSVVSALSCSQLVVLFCKKGSGLIFVEDICCSRRLD